MTTEMARRIRAATILGYVSGGRSGESLKAAYPEVFFQLLMSTAGSRQPAAGLEDLCKFRVVSKVSKGPGTHPLGVFRLCGVSHIECLHTVHDFHNWSPLGICPFCPIILHSGIVKEQYFISIIVIFAILRILVFCNSVQY